MHGLLRSGIVWDLDHTLYETTDEIVKPWFVALSKLAVERGLFDDAQVSFDTMYASYVRYGHGLTQIRLDHGIDEGEFIETAIKKFGDANFTSIQKIEPCNLTVSAITSHRHIPQVVLTSAKREWASRVLERLALDAHFTGSRVVTLEDAGYESKAASRIPFDLAATAIGYPLSQLVMVEDNPNNLKMAKDLGMATVLVTHGAGAHDATHIDFVVNKAYDVFSLISQGTIPWANVLHS